MHLRWISDWAERPLKPFLSRAGTAMPLGTAAMAWMGILCLALRMVAATPVVGTTAAPQVLVGAHAHNDYVHDRPLFDALDHGFQSVEADVHWVDGELRVGHDPKDLQKGRTLTSLYLDPLKARIRKNKGFVYGPGDGFVLMIDVKTEARATHPELCKVLRRYRDILTRFGSDGVRTGAVTVIISGERAEDAIARERVRWWALDGRIPDLDLNPSWHLAPWISASWTETFSWRGEGECPAEDLAKLRKIVARCHGQGRRVRFWATGDTPRAWTFLRANGVDILSADDLSELQRFLMKSFQGSRSQGL